MKFDLNKRNIILVVEDNTDARDIIVTALKKEFEVIEALSGEDALNIFFDCENLPEMILLDVMLPGMDGYLFCSKIKNNVKTKHIPVIFISALFDSKDRIKAFNAGACDYISKPFAFEELFARMRIHLELLSRKESIKEDRSIEYDTNGVSNSIDRSAGFKKVSIWKGDEVVLIDPTDILYIYVNRGKVAINTKNELYELNDTLTHWEEKLSNMGFYRCHKSYLVNVGNIKKLLPCLDGSYMIEFFDSKDRIPLSRSNAKDFASLYFV